MTAESLMLIGGTTAFLLTLYWVRGRELREKYAVLWICVAFGLLVLGLFPELIKRFAASSGLAYPTAVLFIALAGIYLFSMSVSMSLTHQRRIALKLCQQVALLEHELNRLRDRLGEPDDEHRRKPGEGEGVRG